MNGRVGLIFAPRGRLLLVLLPTIRDRRVVELELIAEPHRLRSLELAVLDRTRWLAWTSPRRRALRAVLSRPGRAT